MFEKLNAQPIPVKIVIMLVLAALLGGGAYYFVVMPMEEQNKIATTAWTKKQNENAQLKQFDAKLPELDRQIAQLKMQMELQKSIVPDTKDADKFILMLQENASVAGVQLRKVESKGVANKEYFSELPFAIEVDGPYFGVLAFFEKLSGSTRIVNVEGLSMKTTAKGQAKYPISPSDSVTITAVAKTFYSHDAQTGAPEATSGPAAKR